MPAPIVTEQFLIEKSDLIFSPVYARLRKEDQDRWLMYNGSIKGIVMEAIRKEFKKPETIIELENRLIPLNIPQKIINKLANVYLEPATRKSADQNELDQILLDSYIEALEINSRQKEANRYFKLFKRNLQSVYIGEDGYPGLRNLPRHTYEVFSHSPVQPEIPDTIVIIQNPSESDREKVRLHFWTDENWVITNGHGKPMADEMTDNPEGINIYGKLPFVYINSSTYSVNPIPDDDLLRMGIIFPLLLSDLAYAIKYLSWAVIYVVGGSDQDIPFSPNSIIKMPFGPNGEIPEINTVKPEVDIDKVLTLIEFLVAVLLSTKNLSTSTIQGQLSASNLALGVSKALDSAESIEDKKDQQSFFARAERQLWNLLAKYMIPVWRKKRLLDQELNRDFSKTFKLEIHFQEPKSIISEKDQAETLVYKIDNNLSTWKDALKSIYPTYSDEQIEILMVEIMEDKQKRKNAQVQDLLPEMETPQGYHKHNGLKAAPNGMLHNHEIDSGEGYSSTEEGDDDHQHEMPDGTLSGLPMAASAPTEGE